MDSTQDSGKSRDRVSLNQTSVVEISIVMPCLNEADTIATCIEKAQRALTENNISGEIILADNGSSDDSPTIASLMGARVIHVEAKGTVAL